MNGRRLYALTALVLAAAAATVAVAVAAARFPRGLSVLVCFLLAGVAAWYGLRRRGIPRIVGGVAALLLLAAGIVLIIVESRPVADVIVMALTVGALAAAGAAFTVHVQLPSAARPRRPVLFYNPRSGDGKAARFNVAQEAERRGIEPIELRPGSDLEALVRSAVRQGPYAGIGRGAAMTVYREEAVACQSMPAVAEAPTPALRPRRNCPRTRPYRPRVHRRSRGHG